MSADGSSLTATAAGQSTLVNLSNGGVSQLTGSGPAQLLPGQTDLAVIQKGNQLLTHNLRGGEQVIANGLTAWSTVQADPQDQSVPCWWRSWSGRLGRAAGGRSCRPGPKVFLASSRAASSC